VVRRATTKSTARRRRGERRPRVQHEEGAASDDREYSTKKARRAMTKSTARRRRGERRRGERHHCRDGSKAISGMGRCGSMANNGMANGGTASDDHSSIANSSPTPSPQFTPPPRTSKSSRSSGKQSEHIRESVVVLDHLLSCIPCLHEKFARYSEIDEVMRQAFRTSIPDAPPIAEHEMALITASLLTDAVEPSPQSSKLRNNCKLSPKHLLVVDAMDEIEGEKSAPWLRIPNTVRAPISYFQKALPDGSAIGKAHGVIDASAAAVLAMIMATDVPSYFKEHYEREGTEALMHVEFMPASHSMFYLVHKKLGLTNIGIPDRVFATWLTWWRCDSGPDEGCFFVAFCPIEEYNPRTVSLSEGCASTVNYYKEKEASLAKMKAFKKKLDAERLGVMQELGTGTAWHDIKKEGARKLKEFAGLEKARLAKFKPSEGGTSTSIPSVVQRLNATIAGNPAASKAIRGTTRGFWKIEPLAAEICRTTYVNQGNLGGSVPMAIMK